jgi:hypothetical protein
MERTCRKLALLVGSNPLPNYLAAMALKPAEVILLYTPETQEPKENLVGVFRKKGLETIQLCIADATDARAIREVCEGLERLACDHLHYSGGTKPMAAHARRAFNGVEANISYLDERKGLLRFEDGRDENLSTLDLGLTIDILLGLHGLENRSRPVSRQRGPSESDTRAVAERLLREPSVAKELYDHFRPAGKKKSLSKAKEVPLIPSEHALELSVCKVPDSDWKSDTYDAWEKFLTGGWLEQWSAEMIRSVLHEQPPRIDNSLVCERSGAGTRREFEIDVALVFRQRLYVVSCTADTTLPNCKPKLFEVAMRSRQMGGDLARCALVCLLDGTDSKGPKVEQLRSDIRSLWDAPNVPQVFGLADLREWTGINGSPNLQVLNNWLEE